MPSPIALIRYIALAPVVIVCVVAGLVVVPLVETVRGCAEEWVLAFRRVQAHTLT